MAKLLIFLMRRVREEVGAEGGEKKMVLTPSGKRYAGGALGLVRGAESRAMEKTLEKFSPAFVDAADCFADLLHEEFSRMKPPEKGEN